MLSSRAMYLAGDLGFEIARVLSAQVSMSTLSAALGAGAVIELLPWAWLRAGVSAGCSLGLFNGMSGISLCLGANGGFVVLPGPFHVGLTLAGRYIPGLLDSVAVSLETSYEIGGRRGSGRGSPSEAERTLPVTPAPIDQTPADGPAARLQAGEPNAALTLEEISFLPVFPVFHKYYDDHPMGHAVLSNSSRTPASGIRITFIVRQFMDEPMDCIAPSVLKPGESAPIEFRALLRPEITDITEAAKVQATISLEYSIEGQVHRRALAQSIRVLDRNAMSWEDDRRAAAFVTAKDPAVLSFSKNIAGIVRDKTTAAVNPNLAVAVALHEALSLCGLSYVQDPAGYAQSSLKGQTVDFLQFPRQTLEYRAGDCDDLSILYCALFESIGIESAFLTVPGHIFVAFSIGQSTEEARKAFSRSDDLIFAGNSAWIPVEVTERKGFIQAWKVGAREWREHAARKQASLHPVREAWNTYEPVGLPGTGKALELPSAEAIARRSSAELALFIDQEIIPRATALQDEITGAQDKRKPTNNLGVLYARYGLYDRARLEFERLLARDNYAPALLNLGIICYLNDQNEEALDLFSRAYAKDPRNPRVVLAVARVNHALENYFAARKAFGELRMIDPDLASQNEYLDLRGEEASRSGQSGRTGAGVDHASWRLDAAHRAPHICPVCGDGPPLLTEACRPGPRVDYVREACLLQEPHVLPASGAGCAAQDDRLILRLELRHAKRQDRERDVDGPGIRVVLDSVASHQEPSRIPSSTAALGGLKNADHYIRDDEYFFLKVRVAFPRYSRMNQ